MRSALTICLLAALLLAPVAAWATDAPAILEDVRADVDLMDENSMSEIRGMSNPLLLALLSMLDCSQLRALFTFLITNAQPCPPCPFCPWSGPVPSGEFGDSQQGWIMCNGTICWWEPPGG